MGLGRFQVGSTSDVTFFQRIRAARRIAQPPEYAPNITEVPYRVISIWPSVVLARAGVTANRITLLWIALGLFGVVALGSADNRIRIVGAFLLQLSYLFDFVDGEVARLQNCLSKRGLFWDLAGHGLIKTGLFLALGFALFMASRRPEYLLLSFCACLSISGEYALPFYAARASVQKRPIFPEPQAPAVKQATIRRLVAWGGFLFESSGLYAVILLAALLNRLDWLVFFYGLAGPLYFVYRAAKYRYE